MLTFSKLANIHANLLREGMRRRSRLAILVRDCAEGPLTCSVISGWMPGIPEAMNANRRGVSKLTKSRRQVQSRSRCSKALHALAQFARSRVNHPRRNFFASDFE